MYMILWWKENDYLSCVCNSNGSVRLFNTLKEADTYANDKFYGSDDMRVISIEGVKE